MHVRKSSHLILGASLISALLGSAASGQVAPAGPWGCGYGLPYNLYVGDSIPYFALYPPVYYSYSVPRTYGYSPFAYPPGVMTPEVESVAPAVMINPYVPQKRSPKAVIERTAGGPVTIINPFVVQPGDGQGIPVGSPDRRRSQVIFPASMRKSPVRGAR